MESTYHAFVLQANRRFTNGLQFQTSYTRSSARDNGQTSVTFTSTNTPTDPYNLNLDRGPTSFDIPHRFVGSAVWSPTTSRDGAAGKILNGWTFAPIVTASVRPALFAGSFGDKQTSYQRAE